MFLMWIIGVFITYIVIRMITPIEEWPEIGSIDFLKDLIILILWPFFLLHFLIKFLKSVLD